MRQVMFAEWEGWNYIDSVYFCVTSLAKIGFGDFVPGRRYPSILIPPSYSFVLLPTSIPGEKVATSIRMMTVRF